MFEQAFKNVDDVLRKEAGCTTELDYTEQTSWLLFLKYLDGLEQDKAMETELAGKKYAYILESPYRWETWASARKRKSMSCHISMKPRLRTWAMPVATAVSTTPHAHSFGP